jgi:hypothetical protein
MMAAALRQLSIRSVSQAFGDTGSDDLNQRIDAMSAGGWPTNFHAWRSLSRSGLPPAARPHRCGTPFFQLFADFAVVSAKLRSTGCQGSRSIVSIRRASS